VPVPMAGPDQATAAQASARDQGVQVGCFRPPSVPDGVSRLRLTARADLRDADLDKVETTLSGLVQPSLST